MVYWAMIKIILTGLLFLYFPQAQIPERIVISDNLYIEKISDNLWLHVSLVTSEEFGTFNSNGAIYVVDGEAVVIDTPIELDVTQSLLDWIDEQGIEIKAVIPTHHHEDCLGGLSLFHERNITSYGHSLTKTLATKKGLEPPKNTFNGFIDLDLIDRPISMEYHGEGHTLDNIIVWMPDEKSIFGGCMIKSLGAGKGNLNDANIKDWSNTVSKVKAAHPEALIIIPGHGNHGNQELLDYTIKMFADQ